MLCMKHKRRRKGRLNQILLRQTLQVLCLCPLSMSIAYVSVVEVEEFVMVILGFVLSSIVDKDGEKAKHCIVLFTSFSFLFFLYKKKSLGESSSKLTKVQTSSSKNTYNIIYILPTNKCHSRNQNSRSLGN